jgi:hypothetical protein
MDAAALNRRLNRAARLANLAAVAMTEGGSSATKVVTEKLVDALAQITAVQQSLFRTNPDLEYHSDPKRSPTPFMLAIQQLVRQADAAVAKGDRALALQKLDQALALEPPPLPYEILEKRRNEISRSA